MLQRSLKKKWQSFEINPCGQYHWSQCTVQERLGEGLTPRKVIFTTNIALRKPKTEVEKSWTQHPSTKLEAIHYRVQCTGQQRLGDGVRMLTCCKTAYFQRNVACFINYNIQGQQRMRVLGYWEELESPTHWYSIWKPYLPRILFRKYFPSSLLKRHASYLRMVDDRQSLNIWWLNAFSVVCLPVNDTIHVSVALGFALISWTQGCVLTAQLSDRGLGEVSALKVVK